MERIGDEEVRTVLHKDQGSHAQLISWSHERFAADLQGATADIHNVRVRFEAAGKEGEACYVAKLSPTRQAQQDDHHNLMSIGESRLYSEVVPAITSVLEEVNVQPVSFPKCYYHTTELGKEVLLFENLKEKGYGMQTPIYGLDLAHTSLVLRELGKLHAASVLLQNKLTIDLADKFEFLKTEWLTKINLGWDFETFMNQSMEIGLEIFDEMGDCQKIIAWLKKVKPEVWSRYQELVARKAPFDAIIHGDCWINNMYFRYNEAGQPVEVTFLDLQETRVASVALDLQRFLNLSVPGKVRRPNFDALMATYYDSFHRTVTAGKVAPPFTLDQLNKEYVDTGFYGVVSSIIALPLDHMDGNQTDEDQSRSQVRSLVHRKPLLRPRLLSVMEEWMERGTIS